LSIVPPRPTTARKGADPLLTPYLEAASELEADRCLKALVDRYAAPEMKSIIRRKLQSASADAEDALSEARVQLTIKLSHLRSHPNDMPISQFLAYAATVTHRACDLVLRKRYPLRTRLKNRIRFVIGKSAGLGLWERPNGETVCGFSAWRPASDDIDSVPAAFPDSMEFWWFERIALAGLDPPQMDHADLVARVLSWRKRPIEIDDLVGIVARITGVKDTIPLTESSGAKPAATPIDDLAATATPVDIEVEQRAYLDSLWDEVRQLAPHQCAALLLNLRDHKGRGVASLLPRLGIAGIHSMAEAMGMPSEKLAAIWDDLPFEDSMIASMLGVERQNVIGYRKKARERLLRRMKSYERAE
jgi:hypothetical protein